MITGKTQSQLLSISFLLCGVCTSRTFSYTGCVWKRKHNTFFQLTHFSNFSMFSSPVLLTLYQLSSSLCDLTKIILYHCGCWVRLWVSFCMEFAGSPRACVGSHRVLTRYSSFLPQSKNMIVR
ncbi:hypothetical protein ATANTOWER_021748 [Ataeniobius toweri]|uniref:Secreted protein n=1 Tax=Ataeniobius toweri TaxID=208326 RepID=A0ABU7BCC9_9TELE|nr:hypothetical protein [Ataeniobius toweri]